MVGERDGGAHCEILKKARYICGFLIKNDGGGVLAGGSNLPDIKNMPLQKVSV